MRAAAAGFSEHRAYIRSDTSTYSGVFFPTPQEQRPDTGDRRSGMWAIGVPSDDAAIGSYGSFSRCSALLGIGLAQRPVATRGQRPELETA